MLTTADLSQAVQDAQRIIAFKTEHANLQCPGHCLSSPAGIDAASIKSSGLVLNIKCSWDFKLLKPAT